MTLVIKVTAGENDPERCNQAFTVAAAAIVSGVDVSLWLTGESAWFALPGRAAEFKLPHAAPLEDLLASVLAAGTVTLCSQCAARRSIEPSDVIDGVRIAGAPTFVAEVMDQDARALVYLRPPPMDGAATPVFTRYARACAVVPTPTMAHSWGQDTNDGPSSGAGRHAPLRGNALPRPQVSRSCPHRSHSG